MKHIGQLIMILSAVVMAGILLGRTPQASRAPHAPLARGVHEGVLATVHWRLVLEKDQDGIPVERTPINSTFYKDPAVCAQDGNNFKNIPHRNDFEHIDWLVRCLPYHAEDTETTTPIRDHDD